MDIWKLNLDEGIECRVGIDGTIYLDNQRCYYYCSSLEKEPCFSVFMIKNRKIKLPYSPIFKTKVIYNVELINHTIRISEVYVEYILKSKTKFLNVNSLSVKVKSTIKWVKYINLLNIPGIKFYQDNNKHYIKTTDETFHLPYEVVKYVKSKYDEYISK